MSVISRLALLHSDPRVAEAVRYGFEREGAEVVTSLLPAGAGSSLVEGRAAEHMAKLLASGDVELVVTGATSGTQGGELLERVCGDLRGSASPAPILYLGNGISRSQALAAGASEFLSQPTYLRDVVTVGNLLASPRKGSSGAMGELGDYFGMFYLVRALSAIRRSGVLTMTRGLRRGELRFYQGEVTSAQVGTLHGLAALHQLLLWTEAKFDLRDEDVVRRNQIPLEPGELLEDAERFLGQIRAVARELSPSMVLSQNEGVTAAVTGALPEAVVCIAALFDGNRTIADVIEDSPYRVFETMRVAQRLMETELLIKVERERPRSAARAALAIEEWLVGGSALGAVRAPVVRTESEPVGPVPGEPSSPPNGARAAGGGKARNRTRSKKRRDKKKRNESATTEQAGPSSRTEAHSGHSGHSAHSAEAALESTDWASLLPSAMRASTDRVSGVVPSAVTSGEIDISALAREAERELPSETIQVRLPPEPDAQSETSSDFSDQIRDGAGESASGHDGVDVSDGTVRERLEELTNTEQRNQIFSADTPAADGGADSSSLQASARKSARKEETVRRDEQELAQREAEDAALREARAVARRLSGDVAAVTEPEDAESSTVETDEDASWQSARAAAAQRERAEAAEWDKMKATADANAAAESKAAEVKAAAEAKAVKASALKETPLSIERNDVELTKRSKKSKNTRKSKGSKKSKAAKKRKAAKEAQATEGAKAAARSGTGSGKSGGELQESATGEISASTPKNRVPAVESSIVIDVGVGEPEILATAAAAREVTSAVASVDREANKDTVNDIASERVAAAAASIADSAAHFSEEEEAFFSAGSELAKTTPPPVETFDDLDEGYEEKTFWKRFFGADNKS